PKAARQMSHSKTAFAPPKWCSLPIAQFEIDNFERHACGPAFAPLSLVRFAADPCNIERKRMEFSCEIKRNFWLLRQRLLCLAWAFSAAKTPASTVALISPAPR